MGDRVTLVAFREVDDVSAALDAAEACLRDLGLVAGDYVPEASLTPSDTRVLRPAQGVGAAIGHADRLLSLLTNGVVFTGPGYFNGYGLGFSDWHACPACKARTTHTHEGFRDQISALGMAAMNHMEGVGDTGVICVLCKASSHVTAWRIEDPVFMADMVMEFWNWPALDVDNRVDGTWWKIDALTPLEQAVGRPATVSGHKI